MREAAGRGKAPFAGEKATFGKEAASSAVFRSKAGARRVEVREGEAAPESFDVRYVFGGSSMEQYLVATENGRLQALPVAFDTTKLQWFDIFSGEERLPGEFGHWLGRGMNANSQCIACHATGYRAGYDVAANSYDSTWAESGVGCEACHGAGAVHVADPKKPFGPFGKGSRIAEYRPRPAGNAARSVAPTGAAAAAAGAATGGAELATDAPPAAATPPPAAAQMLDVCAACHSVRRPIADGFVPGAAFLDHFEPTLLDEDNYWPSGQVNTESYEWGSFVQSRMYQKGVNCLACHDVHSGALRAKGNDLCLSCHEQRLAETTHTGHKLASPGSQCVSCHMPEGVFMARDHRRDHSLSIPDALAAKESGIPSACESCHASRGRDTLAADAERLWPSLKDARFAEHRALTKTLSDARAGKPESAAALRQCLSGATCAPAILRASAARLTTRLPLEAATAGALLDALEDAEPLVRSSAAFALADIDPREPMLRQYLSAAAGDKLRAVRLNAAWALRPIETDHLPEEQRAAMLRAFDEWRDSAKVLADAPETWHSLGVFETARRDDAAAEAAYRRAIAIEPDAVPSRQNLAMLLAGRGRIDDAKKELTELLAIDDSFAPAWYALGMILSEQKNWPEAAKTLGRCLKLDPGYPGALTDLTHAYLEAGVPNVARTVLGGALGYPPARREALAGLVLVALKSGSHDEAVSAANALIAEDPAAKDDPEIAKLLATP